MTAQRLDGTATAKAIKAELTARVARLKEHGVVPGLGTVLVGDDPGSRWYVNGKAVVDPAGAKTRSLCWDGKPEALGFTRSGPQFVALSASALGTASLGQGAYRFELYVDGKLILAEGFGIGAFDPALMTAAPTGGVAPACPR